MKKSLLTFIVLGLLFSDCSTSSDPKPLNTCLIISQNSIDGDTKTDLTLTYKSDNIIATLVLVSTDGNGNKTTYNGTLDSKGRPIKLTPSGNAAADGSFSSITYTYDGSDLLTEAKISYGTGYIKESYTYNSSKQLTQTLSTLVDTDSGLDLKSYDVHSYSSSSSKNPTKVENYSGAPGSGTLSSTKTFTYDDKKTPNAGSTILLNNGLTSENNVLTEQTVYSGGSSSTITYTYQYNTQGFPTSRTYTQSGTTHTDTFSYTCK